MPRLLPPVAELEQLAHVSTTRLREAIVMLARGNVDANSRVIENARNDLAQLWYQALTMADLYGRRRMLLETDLVESKMARPQRVLEMAANPLVPRIQFSEAYHDLLDREPRLATTAAGVQEMYATRHAMAFARSTDLMVTRRVQRYIAGAALGGSTTEAAEAAIAKLGDWSTSYARTAYRTNLGTAYAAGRFRQATDPAVSRVFGAFEYSSAHDVDTRPNHEAASGLIAGTKDPCWNRFSPPMGYNCRCSLEFVDVFELRDRGLLLSDGGVRRYDPPSFGAAKPDPGFGNGRPDRRLYG